jgi:hypothetical protein
LPIHEDLSRVKHFDAEGGALGLKLLDALSSTPETSSSAMKGLQSKIVSVEWLVEKTKVDVKVTHIFITRFVSFPMLLYL